MGKVVGIIAEYNPFHNGHLYHLLQAKDLAQADYVVAVISGNFTQRGDTSIVDKWTKAYMAICGGCDLVLELPTVYSISSAENFASGAIKILDSLKIVDSIAFGAEASDLATLNNIANVLYTEPRGYTNILTHELQKGISFPSARENAILMYLNDIKRYANILNSPNNILAIEYLKALKTQKSNMNPIMVKRSKVYYNDDRIVDDFASATAIRKLIKRREYEDLRKVVPRSTYKILSRQIRDGNIVLGLENFEKEIIYTLRKMSIREIANLPDVSEGLENLIKNGYKIVGVVSQVDKPQGRKMVITPTPTKLIGQKYNIPVFQPVKIRDDYAFLSELKPDIILTMAYGQIIPQAVLDIPTFLPLNLHGSILPKYRGASPIQSALLNGDKSTGITLMEMVDKMDAGRMFYKKEIAISNEDNYESLSI